MGRGNWLVWRFWVSLEVVEVRGCGGGKRRADRWALVGVTLVETTIEKSLDVMNDDWKEVRL